MQQEDRQGVPIAIDYASELTAAALDLGLALDERQVGQLLGFLAELRKWNAAYNLTAVRDPHEQLVLHLFDCLAVMPLMNARLVSGATVVDVGSGSGLPGLVIAICRPDVQVHTVDAVSKKAAFVRQLRASLDLKNLHAHHARVESLNADHDLPAADMITSRAFSSLAQMVALTKHLRAPHGCWAAMKGTEPTEEIAALPAGITVEDVVKIAVPQLQAQRHLVWLGVATA